MKIRESWPAKFDALRPDTWGKASTKKVSAGMGYRGSSPSSPVPAVGQATSPPQGNGYVGGLQILPLLAFAQSQPAPPPPNLVSSAIALVAANPKPPPPTKHDFDAKCSAGVSLIGAFAGFYATTSIGAGVVAGIATDYASYAFDKEAKWPLVDENRPIVQAEGTLTEIWVADEDSPFIHDSHDLDMMMSLRVDDRWLSLVTYKRNGQDEYESGGSNLKLETESGYFPPYGREDDANYRTAPNARPSVGDHITVVGRWIFDCGHEPKTEIHPIPIFESDREEVRPLWPGGPMQKVRVVRVWMNSSPGAFDYVFVGPFRFNVDFPPNGPPDGWMPFIRIVAADDPSRVSWTVNGSTAQISITPPAPTGEWYFELMLGHVYQPDDSTSSASAIYTVHLDSIDILNDHDGHFFRVRGEDDGEWFMAANVNGTWRQIFWNRKVEDGEHIPLPEISPIHTIGGNLKVMITAYEEDWFDEEGGEPLDGEPLDSDKQWSDQGALSQLVGAQQVISNSDWILHYTVTRGGVVPPILVNENFWIPRLEDEKKLNDNRPVDLGTLSVPPQRAPAQVRHYSSFITERWPSNSLLNYGDITLLSSDVDRYQFTLDDFADVAFGSLTPGLRLDVENWDPWYSWLPQNVKVLNNAGQIEERNTQGILGYHSARLKVSSTSGQVGDLPYTLEVRRTYRELPLDWGEGLDDQYKLTGQGARVVDLVTVPPNPNANPTIQVYPETNWPYPSPESRSIHMDWAWQHVADDVDYYDIFIPPVDVAQRRRRQGLPLNMREVEIRRSPCQFDSNGELAIISGIGMWMDVWELNESGRRLIESGEAAVFINNLQSKFPNGGHVIVGVRHKTPGKRGFYSLWAHWTGSRYFNEVECRKFEEQYRQAQIEWQQMQFVFGVLRGGMEEDVIKLMILLRGEDRIGPRGPLPDPGPMELFGLGGYRPVQLLKGDTLDVIVSSTADQPVIARLYDKHGVMLGESVALDEETQKRTRAPDGQVPQQRLLAKDIKTNQLYGLKIVPAFDVGKDGVKKTSIGVNEFATER